MKRLFATLVGSVALAACGADARALPLREARHDVGVALTSPVATTPASGVLVSLGDGYSDWTIIGWGDSITEQYSQYPSFTPSLPGNGPGYLDRVATSLGFGHEVNLGIGSTTLETCAPADQCANDAASGQARFRNAGDLVSYAGPKSCVVLAYGMNDVNASPLYPNDLNPTNFGAVYDTVIAALVAKGTPRSCIVVTGISYESPTYWSSRVQALTDFNAAARAVAARNGVAFADTYAAIANNGGLALIESGPPFIHPTPDGQGRIAQMVLRALASAP